MIRKIVTLLFATFLLFEVAGCQIITEGDGSWEACFSIRTKQNSEQPAKVELKSSVIDKVVDSLTDDKVSDAE